MTTLSYAEAHAKLLKEIAGAKMMQANYIVLPLPVAERLHELCEQMRREEDDRGTYG